MICIGRSGRVRESGREHISLCGVGWNGMEGKENECYCLWDDESRAKPENLSNRLAKEQDPFSISRRWSFLLLFLLHPPPPSSSSSSMPSTLFLLYYSLFPYSLSPLRTIKCNRSQVGDVSADSEWRPAEAGTIWQIAARLCSLAASLQSAASHSGPSPLQHCTLQSNAHIVDSIWDFALPCQRNLRVVLTHYHALLPLHPLLCIASWILH